MKIKITYRIERNGYLLYEYDKPEQAVANFEKIAKDAKNNKKQVYSYLDCMNKYFPSGSMVVRADCNLDNEYYRLVFVVEESDPLYKPIL